MQLIINYAISHAFFATVWGLLKITVNFCLDKGIDNLIKLDYIYENADIDKKREVISSMFPEKLHFQNDSLRTGRINEVVRYIYMINNDLDGNKKGQNGIDSILSCQVGMAGFEPTTSSTPCWRDTGLRYIPKTGTANI